MLIVELEDAAAIAPLETNVVGVGENPAWFILNTQNLDALVVDARLMEGFKQRYIAAPINKYQFFAVGL